MRAAYVYIMGSNRNGTIYIGVTSHLTRRIWEHKNKLCGGFTAKYNVTQLVYFEKHDNIAQAIEREKSLKSWRRARKLALIESENPTWKDLFSEIIY